MLVGFAEKVGRITAYPAADAYGPAGEIAMLASNESPFPPLPGVMEAIAEAAPDGNRYPAPSADRLRAALTARFDVAPERIAIGAGSCDLLLSAAEALLDPGTELVHAWPTFAIYPRMAAATGARAVAVPLDADDRHDLDAMADAVTDATRLVVVCNPNNPTGTFLPLAAIERLARRLPPHVWLLVDEAYREFAAGEDADASVALVRRHRNVVLLRTFSKAYGLAGMRCGYALCGDERFAEALYRVWQPFSCSVVAQAAASAALEQPAELARRIELTVAARLELEERLATLGLEVRRSHANFVWHSLGGADEAAVVDGLAERKVLVRRGSALGRSGWLRTTVGTAVENGRYLTALGELLPPQRD